MRHRVVITGVGAVTPLGVGVGALWEGVLAGRSGIRRITRFDPSMFPCQIAGEVPDFDPAAFMDRKDARRMDRFTQLAVASVAMALEDAGLQGVPWDADRVGVIMGTGIGGIETFVEQSTVMAEKGPERVSPFFIPMMIANMAAGHVAIRFGARGPNATVVTACAASAHAIGEAFRVLQRGEADVMITGGAEAAVVPLGLAGFCAMKALSVRNDDPQGASRPFDRRRDGFVMAEGSGALILETLEHARQRGARVHAEVVGYGSTADAFHITQPDPEGQARAMRAALDDAGIAPEQVDYINAHATSTPTGDVAETEAIKRVFGPHAWRLAVSSTKSMTGHLLGAAGAVEAILTALALRDGVLPPTINLDEPDPQCDLDYVPHRARRRAIQVALSNSFGFGGQNASLLLRRFEAEAGSGGP